MAQLANTMPEAVLAVINDEPHVYTSSKHRAHLFLPIIVGSGIGYMLSNKSMMAVTSVMLISPSPFTSAAASN